MNLRWALNRLRAMSVAEVGFRIRRKVQGTIERAGVGLARNVARPSGVSGKPWLHELPRNFDRTLYARAADRILDGMFDVFALRDIELGFPPRWNVDPKTGVQASLGFGKTLDYRDAGRVGDVKYLWEINRHLELVTLAQAWHLTGAEHYAHGCRALLDSWIAQCPYPQGLNWCVSLEHGVRLTNWSIAWFLLGAERSTLFLGDAGREFRTRWLKSIYQHCHFISRHWSRHSSANNHLLGEATGLFVGATTWPLWRASEQWASQARVELARGALEQTFADGVNREQASWYHHAVADMMLTAGLLARANGVDLGDPFWPRLEAMLDFLASITDVAGNTPALGDADEGLLVRFVPQGAGVSQRSPAPPVFNTIRSQLATGAVLFNRRDLAAKAHEFDDKTRWLLGDDAVAQFELLRATAAAVPVPALPRRAFPQGGYYILGERFETDREVRIVADAGPLGLLSIAAHGHADALAFTLSARGKPILVDPGTFGYGAGRKWRRYFKGTSAHNTLVVDGADQSEYGGSFLWLQHAVAQVEKVDLEGAVEELVATHNGYRRLPDPVTHRRTWLYVTSGAESVAQLTIIDQLECNASHDVQICWHFAPECRVTLDKGLIVAARDDVRLELMCPQGLQASLAKGQEEPPRGWHSSRVDVKVPASTAVFAGAIHGDTAFRSQIRISAA